LETCGILEETNCTRKLKVHGPKMKRRVSTRAKELALKIKREICGDPGTKEHIKPRRVLECRNEKTRPLASFSPPCCNC